MDMNDHDGCEGPTSRADRRRSAAHSTAQYLHIVMLLVACSCSCTPALLPLVLVHMASTQQAEDLPDHSRNKHFEE